MSSNPFENLEQKIITCRNCPRLTAWREEVGRVKRRAFRSEDYWARPVPGFGDQNAKIIVVGLAPGAHGSNRTGRMFTGDDSGNFLYPALFRAGFANQANGSKVDDGLKLYNIWITAVCRCVPPDNKPSKVEIQNCHPFLVREITLLNNLQGIVALGRIAFDEILKLYELSKSSSTIFSHGGLIPAGTGHPWILASYHPSRQNTQTGRLTAGMFDEIWTKAEQLIR